MKPLRGLPGSWVRSMPRERQVALGSLMILLSLLALLIVYERSNSDQGPGSGAPEVASPGAIPGGSTEGTPGTAKPDPAVNQGAPAGSGGGVNPGGGAADPGAAKPDTASAAEAPAPDRLLQPLRGTPRVLRGFGHYYSETYGDFRLHPGLDLAATAGDTVRAAAAGEVEAVEQDPADGRVLILRHAGGMSTRYAGLGELQVLPGDQVAEGAVLGIVGEPGLARRTLETHLHFGLLVDQTPVDPGPYLR